MQIKKKQCPLTVLNARKKIGKSFRAGHPNFIAFRLGAPHYLVFNGALTLKARQATSLIRAVFGYRWSHQTDKDW